MRLLRRSGLVAILLSAAPLACGGDEASLASSTEAPDVGGAVAGAAGASSAATGGAAGTSAQAGAGGGSAGGSAGAAGSGGKGGTSAAGTGGSGTTAGAGGTAAGTDGTAGTGGTAAGTGGSGAAGSPTMPIDGPNLKICSFNIRVGTANDGPNAWDKRKAQVFALLKKTAPDFIGMQEDLTFQLQQIDPHLPAYGRFGEGAKDGKGAGEHVSIYYDKSRFELLKHDTFWLSDTPEVPGSISWGNTDNPRVVTWARFKEKSSGYGFYVYNTHFDHRQNPSLAKGARLLSQHMKDRDHPDEPVILTGDFNMHDDEAPIRYLEGKVQLVGKDNPVPLLDTFRALHPDDKNARTAHLFEGSTLGTPIDFIFLSKKDGEVKQSWINHDNENGYYPSDHFPIFATMRLVDKK
jgi:endonuclease/exonuclease/phosphatase family metal-dependent hydrolase